MTTDSMWSSSAWRGLNPAGKPLRSQTVLKRPSFLIIRDDVDLDRYLLRRRLRRWLAVVAVAVVVALIAWADHRGWLLYRGGECREYAGGAFRVSHVIDGGSIQIDVPMGDQPSTTVRLRGIKTPELGALGQPASHLAYAAADYTGRLCKGRIVRLLREGLRCQGPATGCGTENTSERGRLLAFVQLPDGSLLNERLLVAGLARSDEQCRHGRQHRFSLLEQQARHDKVGLWAQTLACTALTR